MPTSDEPPPRDTSGADPFAPDAHDAPEGRSWAGNEAALDPAPGGVGPAADARPIPEIDEYLLDDVPLFHLPMVGSTILTIAFGVGASDEPVPHHGLTHLAEHLVMTKVSDSLDHSNGGTEPFRVTFTLRGTPAEAGRFLRDVCRAIEAPSTARMHEEANVLRTEAAGRGATGMSMRMAKFRLGFQGLGAFALPELFLRTLDAEILKRWVADNMTAGNAAIWIAGELPDDLLVALPDGERRVRADAQSVPDLETPTIVGDDVPGVGASFLVERSMAMTTALRALDRHLRHALRVDRGLGYDVGSDYVALNPTQAIASVWATCLPNAVPDVERIVLETIDDLANRGPDEDELAALYERALNDTSDPASYPGRLDARVRDHLLGKAGEPMSALLDQQWRLRPEHAAAAFRRARDSMIFVVPRTGVLPQRAFKAYPGATPLSFGHGHFFDYGTKPSKREALLRTPQPRLVVANGGVAIEDTRGRRFAAVRWEDCLAVIREPDARFLVGRDGTFLRVFAGEWKDGKGAIRQIEKLGPRGTFVPMPQ